MALSFSKLLIQGISAVEPELWQTEAKALLARHGLPEETSPAALLLSAAALDYWTEAAAGELTRLSPPPALELKAQAPRSAQARHLDNRLQIALQLGHEELLQELLQRYLKIGESLSPELLPRLLYKLARLPELYPDLAPLLDAPTRHLVQQMGAEAWFAYPQPWAAWENLPEALRYQDRNLQFLRQIEPEKAAQTFQQLLQVGETKVQDALVKAWALQPQATDAPLLQDLLQGTALRRPSLRRQVFELWLALQRALEPPKQGLHWDEQAERWQIDLQEPALAAWLVNLGAISSRQTKDEDALNRALIPALACLPLSFWEAPLALDLQLAKLDHKAPQDRLFLRLVLALAKQQQNPACWTMLWDFYSQEFKRNPFSPLVELLVQDGLIEALPQALFAQEALVCLAEPGRLNLDSPIFQALAGRDLPWPWPLCEAVFRLLPEQLSRGGGGQARLYIQALLLRAAYNVPAEYCAQAAQDKVWREPALQTWRREIQQMLGIWLLRTV